MAEFFPRNLFQNISYEEYDHLLNCLNARQKTFEPGQTICCYDAGAQDLGIIGSGSASVVRYEYNGARTILERLSPQDLFGSLFYYGTGPQSGVSVISDTTCQVLLLQYNKISAPCAQACSFHHQLTRNLLSLLSERSQSLSRRVEVLSQRTIRDKLMCYFSQLAAQNDTSSFRLPFTMVDLADYLSIDRSAMTREIKRMKEEHLIELNKKQVRLLQ